MATQRVKELNQRRQALKTARSSWDSTWRDQQLHIMPRRGRFADGERNKGSNKNKRIINGTPTLAADILTAGMMSTLTNPARKWFVLNPPKRELAEDTEYGKWLEEVQDIMYDILRKSNFYTEVQNLYAELGTFGTGVMTWQRDFENVVRFHTSTVGEYYLANSGDGPVNVMYRDIDMTVQQIVERFGIETAPTSVKRAFEKGAFDSYRTVHHAVQPKTKSKNPFRRFESVYWTGEGKAGNDVAGNGGGTVLRDSGMARFNAFTPRWDLRPTDIYGRGPGHSALNGCKHLQLQERDKATGIGMQVRPPVTAPTHMKGQPVANIPGGVTYVDPTGGQASIGALTNVRPDVNALSADIAKTENLIRAFFYADLFASLLSMPDRTYMTATEANQREQEKLILLGPVLQRLNGEFLDPLVNTIFELAVEADMIPPPPPIAENQPLKIEYVSLLHQAQQAVGAASLERATAYITSLAAAFPEVLDTFDADEAARTYNAEVGAPAKILKTRDEVAAIRQAQQAQRAQEQSLAMMQQGAETAQTLAGADMSGQNVLTELTGGGV